MDVDATAAGTGLRGLRRVTWWSTAGLVYAAGAAAVFGLAVADAPALPRIGGIAATVVTTAAGGALLGRPLRRRAGHPDGGAAPAVAGWVAPAGCAGAVGVALLLPQVGAIGSWSPMAPAIMTGAIAAFAPPRARWPIALAGTAVAGALAGAGSRLATGAVSSELVRGAIIMTALFTSAVLTQLWMWRVADRLDDARAVAAELAVADERLRFAAELHDIQGHHLQVIALESELAARLAPTDAAKAAAHMRHVEQLARTALEDTREVVRGYRQVSLAAELVNAAGVLASAGIDCPPPPAAVPERLSEQARHLLGLVVREATTNVLRHSNARRAAVRLDVDGTTAVLEVRNDGAGAARATGSGTGLAALTERLARADGSLEWGRDDGWFRVTARVPIRAGVDG